MLNTSTLGLAGATTAPGARPRTRPAPRAVGGPEPRRIDVAVTPETVHALELIMRREGVSLTEAVRRLIGYGDFVYRSVREDGMDLLLRGRASISQMHMF